MKMQFKHLAAIYHLGKKLENIDGTPDEARLQHLRDYIDRYELPEEGMTALKALADEMEDLRALLLVKDLDRDDKLTLTHLFANIVCTDDKLTDLGRDCVTEIVLTCNLPIPGAEDSWQEVSNENIQKPDDPIVPAFLLVRTDGLVARKESENESWSTLGKDIAEWIGASRVEVVRFTAPLNELSERLRLKGCHLVFLVDANGRAAGKGDNMTGTILYGSGYEIIGDIVLALETDEGYRLEGVRSSDLLNEILNLVNDKVDYLLHLN